MKHNGIHSRKKKEIDCNDSKLMSLGGVDTIINIAQLGRVDQHVVNRLKTYYLFMFHLISAHCF